MPASKYSNSPQFENGRFTTRLPFTVPPLLPMLRRWFFEKTPNAVPTEVAVMFRTAEEFRAIPQKPTVTWLGHSTVLFEIAGLRILTDPVWGEYASPGALFGVKRFYPPPLPWSALPPIDAVLLSHDHYDHLNHETIVAFSRMKNIPRFIVPLAVADILVRWGISREKITELDWWDETTVGPVRIVAAPARHFSGRLPWNRNETLWCSYALLTDHTRIYFGADSAMMPAFRDIGERLGPFDLTMFDTGQYDQAWPDGHMGPEQAVAAHGMVRGKVMMPIHWSLFKLAFHGWTEPVERVIAAAVPLGVQLMIPRPGESFVIGDEKPVVRWWPSLPWKTAAERPIVSTGLGPTP